jgi:hypothetical protein
VYQGSASQDWIAYGSVSTLPGRITITDTHKAFVSINLLVYPGFTDCGEELHALIRLLSEHRPDMIQMRNLNIDPDLYLRRINFRGGPGIGITRFMKAVKDDLPDIQFGYFNRPKEMYS